MNPTGNAAHDAITRLECLRQYNNDNINNNNNKLNKNQTASFDQLSVDWMRPVPPGVEST